MPIDIAKDIKMMEPILLPYKMSPLLRVAFEDVRKIRRRKGYVLHMGSFHEPKGKVCFVCIAGAVMVCTLAVPIGKSMLPYQCGRTMNEQLEAIDYIRAGFLESGFNCLGICLGNTEFTTLFDAWSEDMKDPTINYPAWSRAWRHFIKVCKELGY